MFYLIGTGLGENEITKEGEEALNKCEEIFYEDYTSFPPLKIGKKLSREEVENGLFLKNAKFKNVALLVGGDPLFSTTHISLILSCIDQNIQYKIIHAPSIINVISETGLFIYKFGQIVSLPKFTENYQPESVFEKIKFNKEHGFHTLVLVDPLLDYYSAYSLLKKGLNIEENDILAIKYDERLHFNYAKNSSFSFPFSFIVLGNLNALEKEFLEKLISH
ncbi:MAG: diphthine synthase [Candidatus Rehaiarchaeum fermentans]|nr:diphthine synthase [Candidatus Rehaiarchaeum fermentans]MCW1297492.1 diphthine synthase [Candidatus Rehaiarchaeum fermentans]MCW1302333.1 diphthine synthase [Candidatus Rehaiarchaeum fermentans]